MSRIDLSMKIAIEFLMQYRSLYKRNLYSINTVKESKWWIHFENASTFISYDDVSSFMEYFFKRTSQEDKILPFLLNRKHTKELYETFLQLKDVKEDKTKTIDRIEGTLKQVLLWCKKNDVKENKITKFLENRANIMKIERGTLYEPVFYFSKKYMEEKYVEDLSLRKSVFRISFPNVYDALKKILAEDFLD